MEERELEVDEAVLTRKKSRKRQKPLTETGRETSPLDEFILRAENLDFTEQVVLQGELDMIEAYLPDIIKIILNLPEEE